MKKRIAVASVLAGFIVGWGTASIIAHRNIEKIKAGWSPELQKFVAENTEFCRGLKRADMEQLRQDIRDFKSHATKKSEIQTLWQAILATQIQAAFACGDTNRVHELLADRIATLREAQASGRFRGTDSEKLADSLIHGVDAGTNSPTTGPTVPPSAGASGGQ